MGLREDAITAAETAETDRVDAALAVLADKLAPASVASAEVIAQLSLRVIVQIDDVYLAVKDPDPEDPSAELVALVNDDQGWTYIAKVTSLVDLGQQLIKLGD